MAKKASKANDPRFEVLKMLTPEQKDKLLLKLFRKDPLLVEKLAHEFFEDKSDLLARRDKIRTMIDKNVSLDNIYWHTPGDLMMELRNINGRITEHVKITKDKYGEVELTLFYLLTAFDRFWDMLNEKARRADTFSDYVLKRTQNLLKVLSKLHEDNFLDFKDDLNKLLDYLKKYKMTGGRLSEFDIPDTFDW